MGVVAVLGLAVAAVLLLASGGRAAWLSGISGGSPVAERHPMLGESGHGREHPPQGAASAKRTAGDGIEKVPLMLDLLGTALESGLAIQNALHVVAGVSDHATCEALRRVAAALEMGVAWDEAWEGNTNRSGLAQLHAALSFGALTGASAASLLYAEAAQIRRAGARQAERRAAALGVKLVVPLGLCSLPAFIALGIVPVVLAMVPSF